jgi:hypothetical protein
MKTSDQSQAKKARNAGEAWEPMKVTDVGHVSEVLQGGGGKLTPVGGDPGEMRKQQPVQ